MKTLPADWLETLTINSSWSPDTLARRFFNHNGAEVDHRDGTLYTGRSWASDEQIRDFYDWVNFLGGIDMPCPECGNLDPETIQSNGEPRYSVSFTFLCLADDCGHQWTPNDWDGDR